MMSRTIFMLLISGIVSWPSISPADISAGVAGLPQATSSPVAGLSEPTNTTDRSAEPETSFLADLELFVLPDDPLLTDDRVLAQIYFFMTTGKPTFQNWLDRSAPFIPIMKDIFREKRLPEYLVYMAMIESGLRFNAVSRSQAVGPWQFMPDTAKKYGLRADGWIDERKDPIKSTRAAAAYLRDLYKHFGSWHLAMASYNAGAGKIRRALLQSSGDGIPGLYTSRTLRRETRNYVPKLLAAVMIARDPEKYGFAAKTTKSFHYEEVVIEKSMDMHVIAAFAGCTDDALRELNPELERQETPPHVYRYGLRLPAGTKNTFLANLKLIYRNNALHSCQYAYQTAHHDIDVRRPHEYPLQRRRDTAYINSKAFRRRALQVHDSAQARRTRPLFVPVRSPNALFASWHDDLGLVEGAAEKQS